MWVGALTSSGVNTPVLKGSLAVLNDIRQAALDYHALPKPGKLAIQLTKPTETPEDLSLAYTPGVAVPVLEIAKDPDTAYQYTNRGNLVAVITDGSAVLGLGNVGALAGKPVMEGKAVLFKRFADIDVFDLEINASSPQALIEIITALAPTFGGINLEDIAAPHCFEVEEALIERLDIPVFHDDQHGTAIIVAAALLNALEVQGKTLAAARIVLLGAGAAGVATVRLLRALGAAPEQILAVDRQGVIWQGRADLTGTKAELAVATSCRSLADALQGADVFIGVSGANLVSAAMVQRMAARPIVFALSNPTPEIFPDVAKAARNDVLMATGRSDFPNQVNNVLGFPFIFRGALDVRARRITQAMHIAAVHALGALARTPVPESVLAAYQVPQLSFGPDYILPKPIDPRLVQTVAPAVAQAALASGVARAPYPAHYPVL
jgi:malate dehydrogenase (oxaloacetate-decarboxylating)(NADP+)